VTVKRMDNVGIVVEDIELGLGLEGRALVEGEWAGLAIVKSRQARRAACRRSGPVWRHVSALLHPGPERILSGFAQQLGQQASRANPVGR
jgi:hypothetical protein